ncbi:MAG: beta-N-acetylhexosaminidase [Trueperaceae bacterium]
MHPPLLVDLQGTELAAEERALLARPGVAGVCLFSRNLAGLAQARALVAEALAAADRPLVIAIDQEGGGVVRLQGVAVAPSAMALGAVDDPALTERIGAATGRGLRAIGVNVDFAPVADVQSNPGNPIVGDRSFGADPALVARHVAAFVRGLQATGVAATVKHFPGHGDVAVDSHLALPRLDADLARLEALEWPPFAAGIGAGAAAAMSGHLLVPALDPELPATLSPAILGGALRGRLGFQGLLFTDALDMRAIADGWGVPEAAVLSMAAGVDVPVVCNGHPGLYHTMLDALEAAAADGRLPAARVAEARARLDLLLAAYPSAPLDLDASVLEADAATEHEAARRAVTVLGTPPTLRPGAVVALFGRPSEATSGASDAARPVAALVDALEEAGVPVRWATTAADLPLALAGAQALVVATSERRPLDDAAVAGYRGAFERAREAGVPAVHAALWNPAHVSALPGPAVVPFGFRPASAAALAAVLLGGEARGRSPIPLAPWGGA